MCVNTLTDTWPEEYTTEYWSKRVAKGSLVEFKLVLFRLGEYYFLLLKSRSIYPLRRKVTQWLDLFEHRLFSQRISEQCF